MSNPGKPVALIILDGFGLAEPGPGNAVALAHTPNFDRYWSAGPATRLDASGLAVGLPEGQIGNSEVGHLNIGAGRVVLQSLTYIDEQIRSGEFFGNPVLQECMAQAGPDGTVHLLGLVSDGGVHSSLQHLLALLRLAEQEQVSRVAVHAFTDGRDTAPDRGLAALRELDAACRDLSISAGIASVSGRYYAMDRDQRWERTREAYSAVVCGEAQYGAKSGPQAVEAAYQRGETDEFIRPTVMTGPDGEALAPIRPGDSVIFFNFRADRARQLAHALVRADFSAFDRCASPTVNFCSLMQLDPDLAAPFAFSLPELRLPLAEVISNAGLRQFHAAETEKYAHVTYFFNALVEPPFPGEERLLVPSPQVATYDLQPEMSAAELSSRVAERIREGSDDFVLINFANPDMVGHTGSLKAAVQAVEATDAALGRVVSAMQERDGIALVIADHGNAEQMLEADGESPHTAHTTNQVPCVLVGAADGLRLREGGRLADVAPTVLDLLSLEQPPAMTGESLLLRR